jgi:cytochrome c556
MKRTRTVLSAAVAGSALAFAVAALAAGDPVADRQATMKQVGQAMKEGAGYATGQTPFDGAKVKATMDGVAAAAKKAHGLFPKGSDANPKTSADPKIWANKADFDKRLTEMSTLAAAAGKAKDQAAFKTGFSQLSGTCKSCHDLYRKKKT